MTNQASVPRLKMLGSTVEIPDTRQPPKKSALPLLHIEKSVKYERISSNKVEEYSMTDFYTLFIGIATTTDTSTHAHDRGISGVETGP